MQLFFFFLCYNAGFFGVFLLPTPDILFWRPGYISASAPFRSFHPLATEGVYMICFQLVFLNSGWIILFYFWSQPALATIRMRFQWYGFNHFGQCL